MHSGFGTIRRAALPLTQMGSTSMRRIPPLVALAIALARPALGDAPDARSRAAAAYDEGVAHFDHAEYEKAAHAFLHADDLLPSDDALGNAITAAKRANDHLLVVRAAERAIARQQGSALAAHARQALAEAATHLAKVELGCEPGPCTITFDGDPNVPGSHYVLPGTHRVLATHGQARAEQAFSLEPDSTYRVVLHPVAPGKARHAAEITRQGEPRRDRAADGKPLSPAVFYIGVGTTVVLAGVTTWSGLDALSSKHALPHTPTTGQVDDVRSRARRTDILLGSAVVVGALTTWAGVSLVHWGGVGTSASLVPTPGGALCTARGRF